MDLQLDNIIFGLQGHGGISVYWAEILARSAKNGGAWIEPVNALTNVNRKALNLKLRPAKAFLPAKLDRYARVPCEKGVLHSSYYRIPESNKTKLITSVYDFTYERYRRGPALWIHHAQKIRAIKRSESIICISQSTANDVLKYGGQGLADRIKVTYLGASDIFKQIENASVQLYEKYPWLLGVQSKRKLLLFVGSRTNYKRFDLAVRTTELSGDSHLVVIGGGEPSRIEDQLVSRLMKDERITFIPSVPFIELPLWYNAAHALFYLSDYEGFGLPVIEAALCRCPVIAQNTSSIPEVYGDHNFLLPTVPMGDDVVQRLNALENYTLRESLLTNCQTKAQQFSWENCWEETLEVYKRT